MQSFSRRGLLACMAAGGAALAGGPALAAGRRFFKGHDLPIGLQLYTLGDTLKTDLDGTLGQVAKIGYRTVEMAGLLGQTPAGLRAAFDKAGLKCTSAHIPGKAGLTDLNLDSNLAGVIEAAHVIGFGKVVMPMIVVPDRLAKATPPPGETYVARLARISAGMTADDWKESADFLNAKGKALKAAGLQLGYHNHNIEFAPVGGTDGLSILLKNTDPALVHFEMDVGWVVAGGHDPAALIKAHPGRFRMMHIKDVKASTKPNFAFQMDPADVGQGSIDWKHLLPLAYAAGVRDYFVEQEAPFDKPRIESAKAGFNYLDSVPA